MVASYTLKSRTKNVLDCLWRVWSLVDKVTQNDDSVRGSDRKSSNELLKLIETSMDISDKYGTTSIDHSQYYSKYLIYFINIL